MNPKTQEWIDKAEGDWATMPFVFTLNNRRRNI